MRRTIIPAAAAISILVALVFRAGLGQESGGKKSFDATELARAEELVRDVFKEEYSRAKTDRAARKELAATLLKQAKQIREDPAVRLVALREARDLAGRAGELDIAFQAIAELARDNSGNVLDMKEKVLHDALSSLPAGSEPATQAEATALAEVALDLAGSAADAEDFDRGVRLGELAEHAARRGKALGMLAGIHKRNDRLRVLQKQTARIRPFVERLKQKPLDPEANLEVGRYWALFRGNWFQGLTFLTHSGDTALQKVAVNDLRQQVGRPIGWQPQAQDAKDRLALAEAWQEVAQHEKGSPRLQMLARAYMWYREAAYLLEGPARKQVEEKMASLRKMLPPEMVVFEITSELRRLEGHTAEVLGAALSADGRYALSASADRTARLWNTATGQELTKFDGHGGGVFGVAFAPDGALAASCGEDKTIRIWKVATGKERYRLEGHQGVVNNVAFSPAGKLLASASEDRTIRLWDVAKGKEVRRLEGHTQGVYAVAFTPEGGRLASGGSDQKIRLWDVESGKELRQLEGHTGQVLALAFSPDGRRLLSSGEDQTIRLWEVEGSKEQRRYEGHTAPVGGLAFAPDGLRFLSCSDDRTIRLWEVETGKELRRMEGHTEAVYRVVFSRDGRLALSCSLDRTVRIWGGPR
jgi:hypothetical protein